MERWEEIIEKIKMPTPEQNVFIWGAGNTSELNHQGMLREHLYDELGVQGFLDSKLAGTTFNGFSVFHPDILTERDPVDYYILISTMNEWMQNEIFGICKGLGICCFNLDMVVMKLRRDKLLQAAKLLETESQELFHKLLEYRVSFSNKYDTIYAGESYFGIPEFCRPSANDVAVDCGAYVGDSAERFIWRMDKFKRYIAIEPDQENYNAMEQRFSRLKKEWNIQDDRIVAVFCGVDEITASHTVSTRVNGLSSKVQIDKKDNAVTFWALDELINEEVSYIKADIEGHEYRMLLGAKNIIKTYKPRIAVCVYHNVVDMFSLPILIKQIDSNYKLHIRHHSYGFEESVLYAVPIKEDYRQLSNKMYEMQ